MMQSVGDTATGCQGAVTGLMFTWVPDGVHVCMKLAPDAVAARARRTHSRIPAACGELVSLPIAAHSHPQLLNCRPGVLYLEQATFVTGETLHIDGGQTAGH
jgi:hypothetical protein